ILSKNCAEWVIADVAISMAGLVSVPIYPTAGADTISYVLEHSGARVVIVGRLDDLDAVRRALSLEVETIGLRYPGIDCQHDWQAMIDSSEPIGSLHRPTSDEVMTILYTSGSTGRPKGVVTSYGAYQYASRAGVEMMGIGPEDRALSYLPLAHVTERTVIVGPAIYSGYQLFFVDRLETFLADLLRAEPTLFISVPRLWVQFQTGVHKKMPPNKLDLLLKIPVIGKRVARKVRKGLGLDSCRLVGSGTAPISPLTLRWYENMGVHISEGWGMTETTGLSCTNLPFRIQCLGTIGAPLPGTEMKLSEEGEILIRSPGLFTEYYKQPELTAEVFTSDGFFHTGDKGEWREDVQAFRITGRVKDMFKSAKGKYVAPVPIEGKLAGNPLIEQVCVMGAGLRAPVAVVVPSTAAGEKSREAIESSFETTLHEVNEMLESHERLSTIYVVEDPWTIEKGLLTPTMKIKRDKLEARYDELIRQDGGTIVWSD
ncbi:MAG: AMP-binding protein, partial [Gammaproteobacteria bacterium]|nr:AMP-binding protein [Gammaproteobacteria bacterium]NNL49483.1 AMP-binding protein [Woeseiaceae bacterium]